MNTGLKFILCCVISAPVNWCYSCTIMVLNRGLYHHIYTAICTTVGECVSGCIATSKVVVVGSCCNLTMGYFTNTKVYLLLYFLSICWEKEREYKSWVDEHVMRRGWEGRHRPWIFFLIFSCSPNTFVTGFVFTDLCLEAIIFVCLYLFASGC